MDINFINITPLIAGTKWEWTETISGYPASEYTLALIIRNGAEAAKTFNSQNVDGVHTFSISSSSTNTLSLGDYKVQMVAMDSEGNVDLIFSGTKRIEVLLSTSGDARSYNEKLLAAIRDVISSRATREQSEMLFESVDGTKQLKFMTMQELLDAEDRIESRVIREQRAQAGLSGTPQILEEY